MRERKAIKVITSTERGLGIANPCMCQDVHIASFEASEMIVKSILNAENDFDIYEHRHQVKRNKKQI